MKRSAYILCILAVIFSCGCGKDYLNTSPNDEISEEEAFSTVANAKLALNGIYNAMYIQYSGQEQDGQPAIMINLDFMGEDIVHKASGTSYFRNSYKWVNHRNESGALPYFVYRFYYKLIANANMILKNIDALEGEQNEKNTIKAEALAIRGWAHFQLVQLFGIRYDAAAKPNNQLGVPVMTSVSEEGQPRATVEEVYAQINDDLDAAIAAFEAGTARNSNTHINLFVAEGIRARVALTMQDWPAAAEYAKKARGSYALMSNAQIMEGFSSLSNPEWMWCANQLADQLPTYGSFFAYMSANFNSAHTRPNPKLINSKLYAAIKSTDVRKKLWWDGVSADFPKVASTAVTAKYMHRKYMVKDATVSAGDIPYMRVAEMYLIEAEALARNGQDAAAAAALYPLAVNRDPSYTLSTKTGQDLIDEIMTQRRIELWGEGFRFMDLKRTNSPLDRSGTGATTTLATVGVSSPIPAGDKRWQFMIPIDELHANGKMVQNPD